MKIIEVSEEHILFDNGSEITFDHHRDCCEYNYADFEQLDDIALAATFKEDLIFESIENAGFRFGNKGNMHFVPCYSSQNGWYSTEVSIYYNGELKLSFGAEEDFC